MGKELKKKKMFVLTDQFAIYLKLAQHYKSIIFQ